MTTHDQQVRAIREQIEDETYMALGYAQAGFEHLKDERCAQRMKTAFERLKAFREQLHALRVKAHKDADEDAQMERDRDKHDELLRQYPVNPLGDSAVEQERIGR